MYQPQIITSAATFKGMTDATKIRKV
eukprot:SAG31_NODE_23757_length_495_cov_0.517588_1_plen_25_part_01